MTPTTQDPVPSSSTVPPSVPRAVRSFEEFDAALTELDGLWSGVKPLLGTVKSLEEQSTRITQSLAEVRRSIINRGPTTPRVPGQVTDECARAVAAAFIAHCENSNRLNVLCSFPDQRQALSAFAHDTLGVTTRTALSTAEIPLPSQYGREIRELISDFGVVRRRMLPYPIGMGASRPARMGTRPAFGSIAMSIPLPEKSPALSFASLESHKFGGIVRLPREIDEQSIVAMGQFLSRYGAVEFARVEDEWGFLADGTAPFEQVKGICKVARETFHTHTLAAGDTKPSDATLDDFRAVRTKVNKAALNGRLSAYYLDTTWETQLPSFRTAAEPNVYQRLPDGTATLDGYPIVWTDVLTPYGTADAGDAPLAVFGALSFWWMGEHGTPRMDTSDQVWFMNDQLAIRFIEEIDFDYAADDATAVLLTHAAA
jgi:HK97 family phage major capsid protein